MRQHSVNSVLPAFETPPSTILIKFSFSSSMLAVAEEELRGSWKLALKKEGKAEKKRKKREWYVSSEMGLTKVGLNYSSPLSPSAASPFCV